MEPLHILDQGEWFGYSCEARAAWILLLVCWLYRRVSMALSLCAVSSSGAKFGSEVSVHPR